MANPEQRSALWREAGFEPPAGKLVTLFGYEQAPVEALLEAWANASDPIVVALPAGRLDTRVAAFMKAGEAPWIGRTLRRGALELRFLPFLPQQRYDELLWSADWNFVRGEDSFVRAQWAERPFVWQLYPQEAEAHVVKLEAFLALYCQGLRPEAAALLGTLWRAWNAAPSVAPSELAALWAALAAHEQALREHARDWALRTAAAGDLAINLDRFCAERS